MEYKIAEKYYCPMKCEGEKVYDQPGDCPVCNMHLVPVNGQKSGKEHEQHANHQHRTHHVDHSSKPHSQAKGKY